MTDIATSRLRREAATRGPTAVATRFSAPWVHGFFGRWVMVRSEQFLDLISVCFSAHCTPNPTKMFSVGDHSFAPIRHTIVGISPAALPLPLFLSVPWRRSVARSNEIDQGAPRAAQHFCRVCPIPLAPINLLRLDVLMFCVALLLLSVGYSSRLMDRNSWRPPPARRRKKPQGMIDTTQTLMEYSELNPVRYIIYGVVPSPVGVKRTVVGSQRTLVYNMSSPVFSRCKCPPLNAYSAAVVVA